MPEQSDYFNLNLFSSLNNIYRWALMRALVLLLCIANLALIVGHILFSWFTPSYYIEYGLLALMLYWAFTFRSAFTFLFSIYKDKLFFKKNTNTPEKLKASMLQGAEQMAYMKERQEKGMFSNTHRHLVVNTYEYNIDHLSYVPKDLSQPIKIYKTPYSNIIIGLEEPEVEAFSETDIAILQRINKGMADKYIARELKFTPSTVRSYNSRIFKRLGVKTRKQAATEALKQGLIEPSD